MHQQKAGLAVKEDAYSQIYVQHLMAVKVTDLSQVFRLIKKGNENRSMRQTDLNHNSSRGHSILQFLLEQRPLDSASSTVTRSKINFVDLAGSERYPAENSSKARVNEMNSINVSLSALANVVSSLVAKEKHVPYRDSKLTHLLKDSLGGNCNTYVIATISPSVKSFNENVSTLKFADRASSISNNAVKNVQQDMKNLLEMKDREIDRLRAMVMAFAEKQEDGAGDLARTASQIDNSDHQLQSLKGQVEQLQEALNSERRRALELESLMRGVTVVDAPDLLDADSLRRDASLNAAVGTSSLARDAQRIYPPNGVERSSARFSRKPAASMVADDLSMFALGPPPLSATTPRIDFKPRTQTHAPTTPTQGVSSSTTSPAPGSLKRRPRGRPRQNNQGGNFSISLLAPLPDGPLVGTTQQPPVLPAKEPTDPRSMQNRNYQQLLDMYSKLASDVADLNIDLAPGAAKRRKNQFPQEADDIKASSPVMQEANFRSQQHGESKGGWGLRNILVSRGGATHPAVPAPVLANSLNTPPRGAPGGFGLRSILQKSKLGEDTALKDANRIMSHRDATVRLATKRVKNPDVFDAGSWIYIMGTSTSSLKAKQIAASTKNDPRMAKVALKSVALL